MLQKKITLIWNVQNGKSIETGYIHISLCIWPYREEFHSSARKFEDELLVGTLKKNKWQGNKKIYEAIIILKKRLYKKYNHRIQSGSAVNIIFIDITGTPGIELIQNYTKIIFWKCREQKCV